MKAEIVYNKHEKPRILLTLETTAERELFMNAPDLQLVRAHE